MQLSEYSIIFICCHFTILIIYPFVSSSLATSEFLIILRRFLLIDVPSSDKSLICLVFTQFILLEIANWCMYLFI